MMRLGGSVPLERAALRAAWKCAEHNLSLRSLAEFTPSIQNVKGSG
jgi:hypothetical protein